MRAANLGERRVSFGERRVSFGARLAKPGAWIGAGLVVTSLLLGGCEPYGTYAAVDADAVSVALSPTFGEDASASFFFYRIKSRKTGERRGIGRAFRIEERRQVRAVLQLAEIDAGTPLLVHVMWLNPDGKKVYTKEVFIGTADWASQAGQDSLANQRVTLDPDTGFVEIESRYSVGPDRFDEELHKPEDRRTFKTGTWSVRVYLYRKRILESSFELLPPE